MANIAIVEACKELPDGRQAEGKRRVMNKHCLALFTLVVILPILRDLTAL